MRILQVGVGIKTEDSWFLWFQICLLFLLSFLLFLILAYSFPFRATAPFCGSLLFCSAQWGYLAPCSIHLGLTAQPLYFVQERDQPFSLWFFRLDPFWGSKCGVFRIKAVWMGIFYGSALSCRLSSNSFPHLDFHRKVGSGLRSSLRRISQAVRRQWVVLQIYFWELPVLTDAI